MNDKHGIEIEEEQFIKLPQKQQLLTIFRVLKHIQCNQDKINRKQLIMGTTLGLFTIAIGYLYWIR